MQILKLDGNSVDLIACPPEDIRKGDYMLLGDLAADAGLIVQAINTGYANIPGLLEDLLRETSTKALEGVNMDLLGTQSYIEAIKNAKVFNCKVRRAVVHSRLSDDTSWTPCRSTTSTRRLSENEVLGLIDSGAQEEITVGKLRGGTPVSIPLSGLDGKLNIITGKKGTGKSHLSKLLLLSLLERGGICIVFDVNGEYIGLGDKASGENPLAEKVHMLYPGENFRTTLAYTGLKVFLGIASSVLDLPPNSAWEVRRIWTALAESNSLTLKKLGEAMNAVSNGYIREALLRRYESLLSSNLFTDDLKEASTIEDWLTKCRQGGALVFNLKNLAAGIRQIVVEFILVKLKHLLEDWFVPAVFLFAEEAHLYLRETYWEDLITRMRHLGVFPTFITNQPDSINESIYRQADNIFLFNFTNENDLQTVSKATMTDVDTVTMIAKELPTRHCLILGRVVNNFPIVVKVREIKAKTMGETRFFFPSTKAHRPERLLSLDLTVPGEDDSIVAT
jgi:DNA helicase HerA-like ATPase